jgi:carboxymethylenebutenolidase
MIIKDTESVDVHTSTGSMRTYLFRPAAEGRYPGLLLYSEIFQVTGPIREEKWDRLFCCEPYGADREQE